MMENFGLAACSATTRVEDSQLSLSGEVDFTSPERGIAKRFVRHRPKSHPSAMESIVHKAVS